MSLPALPFFPAAVEESLAALRRKYRDAVRLCTGEEILAELAGDTVTARLHADTAQFHHRSAHAYARALEVLGEGLDVDGDKQEARSTTREADLVPMRCLGRRYGTFDPDRWRRPDTS